MEKHKDFTGSVCRISCLLIAVGALFAIPATAGELMDILTVYAPDNSVYESVSVDQSSEDPSALYEISDSSIVNVSEFGDATTLCNSVCTPSSPVSDFTDIFGVDFDGSNYYLGFSADDPGGESYGPAGATFIVNTGIPYDATEYLATTLQGEGYTATFQTGVASTPEPSTTLMVCSGLALVMVARRYRASFSGSLKRG